MLKQIKSIEAGTALYDVYAKESPDSDEQLIAMIITESQMVTSKWGDKRMFFRHQRADDDLRYRPEWTPHYPYFPSDVEIVLGIDNGDIEPTLHPYQSKTRSSCPFSWIFE